MSPSHWDKAAKASSKPKADKTPEAPRLGDRSPSMDFDRITQQFLDTPLDQMPDGFRELSAADFPAPPQADGMTDSQMLQKLVADIAEIKAVVMRDGDEEDAHG